MQEPEDASQGFTIAVVTGHDPIEISIQELALDIDPDDFFTTDNMPRGRDYLFDPTAVRYAIADAGYVATAGLQWTGTHWAAVVIPREDDPVGPDWSRRLP